MDWNLTEYGCYCHPYAVKRDGDDFVAYLLRQDGPRQRPQLLTVSGQTAAGYNTPGGNKHRKDRAVFFETMEAAQAACEKHVGYVAA